MITTITEFRMAEPITLEEAESIFKSTAPKYLKMSGLIRKCYMLSEDGLSLGGAYLWESRAHAEAIYTESWREFVREKYGTEPSVTYFQTPVVVDNVTNKIYSDK